MYWKSVHEHGLHLVNGHSLADARMRSCDKGEVREHGVVRLREGKPARGVESTRAMECVSPTKEDESARTPLRRRPKLPSRC